MEKIDHIAIVVTNINHAVNWYTENRDCKVNYQDDSWAELQFDNIKLAFVYGHDTFGNIIERIKYEKSKS